jgi:glycosyltransferase involved in cell wall biosynthesis
MKAIMRTVIVQYAGDYRQAAERIQKTGEETYYAQRYSVEAVSGLVGPGHALTVICCLTDAPYNEMLANGVRAIGAGFSDGFDERSLIKLVEQENPDQLIVRTPAMHLLRWAVSRPFRTLAVFADSFSFPGLSGRLRAYRWAKLLNQGQIEWVLNHGLNSCLSLQSIGVAPSKVVPWDWPALVKPDVQSKVLPLRSTYGILFVGLITFKKGIGDVLRAVAELKRANLDVRVRIAGGGDIDTFSALAKQLQIDDRAEFLGLLPHDAVLEQMREADLVVVPSHHDYAEGFPMTIYETLCARTPLVASDHPMFRANLTHELDAWIFPAGDVKALAQGITRLISDGDLYRRLSAASADTWARLQLPVKWAEAIERWVLDSAENRQWFLEHSLASGVAAGRRKAQTKFATSSGGLL